MSDLLLLAKVVVKVLVLPPMGPLLVTALGLGLLNRSPRTGRLLAWGGLFTLFALSTPAMSFLLLKLLGTSPPLDLKEAQQAQAIVILGGGVRGDALEYGGDTLGRLTLERVRYGARVARQTALPVLVTGGSISGAEPEASLMQQSLESEFGVRVRWSEPRSRNTHENAVFSAQLLRNDKIGRVVLVAHSFDMPRARAEFDAAGIEVIPAPTVIPSGTPDSLFDFMPSVDGLLGSYYATYELLANVSRACCAGK